jgi:hypothetical protein
MGMNNRMKITNDAVILFLQSLPKGCKFGILGFGSSAVWEEGEMNDYCNETKDRAIRAAEYFESDYGGTDILNPLIIASTVKN